MDILQVLNWIGYLSLSLLSITIPTYAISVAFLGRESRRSVWDRERKQKDLRKKLQAMSGQSDVSIEALRKEIDECEKDIQKLNARSNQLSVTGAFIYPFVSFAVGLAFSVLGISVHQTPPSSANLDSMAGVASTLFVLFGIYGLYRSLRATNEAALSPETHAALRVSFVSGSTAQTFLHSGKDEVLIALHNYGREMAENMALHLYFPPEFAISNLSAPSKDPLADSGKTFVQPSGSDYLGFVTWEKEINNLHADMLTRFSLGIVKMPSRPEKYNVPVRVWEKRLGRSESVLTFDVI